jgi:putative glycosyltransferase (TIGR04348 family)
MSRPLLCIVTPALADANNGNWQTASRWARLLGRDYRVALAASWAPSAAASSQASAQACADTPPALLVALHARRSADSIQRFAKAWPQRPLVVVLTGTDLYRDIHHDAAAQHSLDVATALVVLHERAALDLPARHRAKAFACFQSTRARAPLRKTDQHLRALMVGHLREEKSPQTYFEAARLLNTRADILLDHIGAPLDPALGDAAQATQRDNPRYHWLGAVPHAATRGRIQRAHVLVHASRMEGGAHVVMEAVRSGTPVLASRISGNVGMLGSDYGGYFEPGDATGLATLLRRCRDEPPILATLRAQCNTRAPHFEPARERATLLALMADLLETTR